LTLGWPDKGKSEKKKRNKSLKREGTEHGRYKTCFIVPDRESYNKIREIFPTVCKPLRTRTLVSWTLSQWQAFLQSFSNVVACKKKKNNSKKVTKAARAKSISNVC
jgi:hypothetical protein